MWLGFSFYCIKSRKTIFFAFWEKGGGRVCHNHLCNAECLGPVTQCVKLQPGHKSWSTDSYGLGLGGHRRFIYMYLYIYCKKEKDNNV